MAPRVWLITGASSGMGRAMTERVLSEGDIAVATLRKPQVLSSLSEQYPASQLLVLKLDVTQPKEISAAFEAATRAFGRVDVVFSNAGYAILGEVESVPDAEARRLFDTNFWGAMNVAREAVRQFREVNKPIGGRLITIVSALGVATSAAFAYYTLESGLECLSKELNPAWNIKMTNILPGGFATRGAQPESLVQTPPHPAYNYPESAVQQLRAYIPNAPLPGDTVKAMKMIYHKLSKDPNPPLRVPLGKDAVTGFRARGKLLLNDATSTEVLSEDLLIEGKELMTNLDEQ